MRLATEFFHPGMRIAVACSGGADSVALLRALLDRRHELGLVLSVAHLNHGIRAEASDEDACFVERLAASYDLPLYLHRVDTPALALADREGLEEAARRARYQWFWSLLADGRLDAVATAHTLDDQAETVLHRLLRGAWTEGLGGIHPILKPSQGHSGVILRPLLAANRVEIETFLHTIAQPWREDASNLDLAFTRNRLRHQLLPTLATYNPSIQKQLVQLATLARDEEAYWQVELARLLPSMLLSGKAVRGGGRATSTLAGDQSLSLEIERLRSLQPALCRRVLRAAAAQLGVAIDFDETERLLHFGGLAGPAAQPSSRPAPKLHLENGLRAERSARELKLFRAELSPVPPLAGAPSVEYRLPIPGAIDAYSFGLHLKATFGRVPAAQFPDALLRAGRAADRVTLRHSRSRLKIKEAFLRSRLPLPMPCPVLEWQGEIVWIPGLALESATAQALVLSITSAPL